MRFPWLPEISRKYPLELKEGICLANNMLPSSGKIVQNIFPVIPLKEKRNNYYNNDILITLYG